MDDLNKRLEEILNDPASMSKVKMMAESLLGDDAESEKSPPRKSDGSARFDSADVGRIMSIIGKIENSGNDNRARLLLALKPHLSARRGEKVDSAVKLLKLIDALPLLKESGILDFG